MPLRIGINGFGRIGRALARLIWNDDHLKIAAINDTADSATLAHLLKYDSIYSKFAGGISLQKDHIILNGSKIRCFHYEKPSSIPWDQAKIDIVIESSGFFTSRSDASDHLKRGCKAVLITAASRDADVTICFGINNDAFDPKKHRIISSASCTTHCLAPVLKVIHENFGIKSCFMTTIHSYTTHQSLLDSPNSDLRRSRAAALSIIPTTTSAIQSIEKVLPYIQGKIVGSSMRVPTPAVSLIDLSVNTDKRTSIREVNGVLRKASQGDLRGILGYSDEDLVSLDFRGSACSAILDAQLTSMIGKDFLKVSAWYDNEWGYCCRLVDTIKLISRTMKPEGKHE